VDVTRRDDEGRTSRRSSPALLIVLGLVGASILTWRTSTALFTATTQSGANTFGTGSVTLGDNDAGSALFTVTGMKPGSTGQGCINVTYSGTLPSMVRIYGTGETATNSLDNYITVQIEEGSSSATTFPSCAGFVPASTAFNSTLNTIGTSFAAGYGTWAPPGPGSKDYRFTYTLSASAPNSVMNSTASVTFTWEAQNS
jgi:hypothetical protein